MKPDIHITIETENFEADRFIARLKVMLRLLRYLPNTLRRSAWLSRTTSTGSAETTTYVVWSDSQDDSFDVFKSVTQ